MDMKLLSATGTNLVSRPLSGMCTAGQTKWQLIIQESLQRLESTLGVVLVLHTPIIKYIFEIHLV